MSEISKFFDSLNNGAKWKAGVAFTRTGALPLDDTSVFASETAANEYAATGGSSYPGQFVAVVTETEVTGYVVTQDKKLLKLATTSKSGDVGADLEALQGALSTLDQDVTGIEEQITAIIGRLDTAEGNRAYKLEAGDGITVSEDAENKKTVVSAKVSADEGNDLTIGEDGGLYLEVPEIDIPEYTLTVAATTTEGYAKTYELQKDGVAIGSKIDIPKDMVVSSGVIVENPEGQEAGTYIELTLANNDGTKLYINVSSLLDEMPIESEDTDTIDVTVDTESGKYIISAEVKDGSIGIAQLSDDVVASLNSADTAVQEIASGSANGTIAVDGTDVAVTGLTEAAFTEVDDAVTADSENLITSGAVSEFVATSIEENRLHLDTEIDENSTDTEAASAKAVYTAITEMLKITRVSETTEG